MQDEISHATVSGAGNERESYTAPQLIRYGPAEELTAGGPNIGGPGDELSPPNALPQP